MNLNPSESQKSRVFVHLDVTIPITDKFVQGIYYVRVLEVQVMIAGDDMSLDIILLQWDQKILTCLESSLEIYVLSSVVEVS